MIRSTKHTTKYMNRQKLVDLRLFITEYRRVIELVVSSIFSLEELPKYLDSSPYTNQTWLSARVLRRLVDQARGIVIGIRASRNPNKIPDCSKINPSLNYKHYNTKQSSGYFNEFIALCCLGNKLRIRIPIKYHKRFHKWNNCGRRMSGIEINENWIKINFEVEVKQQAGIKIGIDQGINKTITISNNQTIRNSCNHSHTISSILDKLTRKKKGSKAFRKAQEHRKNFINWSINQLNLNKIGLIGLEKLDRFKRSSRKYSHWTYGLIKKKIFDYAEEHGVHVIEQSNQYRSQRCSSCGFVRKSNRKGSQFLCLNCGFKSDADLNASINHEKELPTIGFLSKLNKSGFYWLESGLFNLEGESLQSSLHKE